MMLELCVDNSTLTLMVLISLILNNCLNYYYVPDAMIEGPLEAEGSPLFLSEVLCTGTEQSFNQCVLHTPPNRECTAALLSCGRPVSKYCI